MGQDFNVVDAGKFVKASEGWAWKLRTTDEVLGEAVQQFVIASTNLLSDRVGQQKLAYAINGQVKLAQSLNGPVNPRNLTSPGKNYTGNPNDIERGSNGQKEIGYSAQVHAAEELNAKLTELVSAPDPRSKRAAYVAVRTMLQNIRDTFHPDFNSALHESVHKNNRETLGAAATKLLQTMPPVTDMARVTTWATQVQKHVAAQVKSLMNSTRVVNQRNTLRKFWDKSLGKMFGPKKAPKPIGVPPQTNPGIGQPQTPDPMTAVAGSRVMWRAF